MRHCPIHCVSMPYPCIIALNSMPGGISYTVSPHTTHQCLEYKHGYLKSPLSQMNTLSLNCSEHAPNSPDYTHLLLTATQTRSLPSARSAHATLFKSGLELDIILHNHLLNMYSKCGSTQDTQQLFDEIPQPNLISWNILISHYAQSGLYNQAHTVFHQMHETPGLQPDSFTFSTLLRITADVDDVRGGTALHACAMKLNCDRVVSVATALVLMYVECRHEDYAYQFFRLLDEMNLAVFNSMISGSSKTGNLLGSMKLFVQMLHLGISPDQVSFLSSLRAAAADGFLGFGTQVHAHVIKMGFESNISISSALVGMYSSHGEMNLAYEVFNRRQPSSSLILWTAIISGFAHNGEDSAAIDLLRRMLVVGIKPDLILYASALRACASILSVHLGKELHAHIIRTGFASEILMGNLLISLYSKYGRAEDGFKVFEQMKNSDAHTWSQIILLCAQESSYKKALALFIKMINEGLEVEQLTIITVLQVCADHYKVQSGQQLHAFVFKLGLHLDLQIASALVCFYSKHGLIEAAHTAVYQIPHPDTVLWTALISAYDENGDSESALKLFCQMISTGTTSDAFTLSSVISSCAHISDLQLGRALQAYAIKRMVSSDLLVGNALISLYSECGSIHLAAQIFHQMPEHDASSWGSLTTGYTRNEQPVESHELFTQMQAEQVKPDELVISAMISCYSFLVSLNRGCRFHALALKLGFDTATPVCNSLITMYSRCGHIDEAYSIFREMGALNTVSWNTMILGLAQNGRSREALGLFEEMRETEILPIFTTFIAVLTACSHEGLVHEGQRYFDMMKHEYNLEPTEDHYSCMVDLFSRVGNLDQALGFIAEMPFSPSATAWLALLSGCRTHGEVKLGKLAGEHLISIQPDEASAYVLLANIYADAGLWECANEIRERMKSRNVKKEPGCSWIEIDDKVHVFTVRDISYRETEEIYKVLKQLHKHLKTDWSMKI